MDQQTHDSSSGNLPLDNSDFQDLPVEPECIADWYDGESLAEALNRHDVRVNEAKRKYPATSRQRNHSNGNSNGRYRKQASKLKEPEEESESVPSLEAFDLADLLKVEFEPLQWIIHDYLPEGLALLFSRPKIGKSMVALALSLRMARRVSGGVDGEVLYLSLDDTSRRRLQSRTRDLLQGAKIEGSRVWAATQARTLDGGLVDQLNSWMKEHPDTRLLVIDVYARVKPKKRDDDVYKSDYEALIKLQEFAVQHHLAVILVHHTRKKNDGEDWIDGINGSTGLAGAVDTIWMLERQRGSTKLKLRVTGRDVEDCEVALSLDDLDIPWMVQDDGQVDINASELKVIEVLQSAGSSLPPKEIAERAGLKTARVLMRRMLAKNLVIRTTYGLYDLPTRVTESSESNSENKLVTLPNPAPQVDLWAKSNKVTHNEQSCYSVTLATDRGIKPTHSTSESNKENEHIVTLATLEPELQRFIKAMDSKYRDMTKFFIRGRPDGEKNGYMPRQQYIDLVCICFCSDDPACREWAAREVEERTR